MLNGDRELVMKAIDKVPGCVKYISPELKRDRELMIFSIRKYPCSFKNAAPELQFDIPFILDAVKIDGLVYRFLDESFKNNKEITVLSYETHLQSGDRIEIL